MMNNHDKNTVVTAIDKNNDDNHEEEEYTDYSCSTNLERLARDIETMFRSWHVRSSDRHFSSGGMGPLRTSRIVWNIMMIGTTTTSNNLASHASLELELTLWDGPPPAAATASTATFGESSSSTANTWLPFGLRRRRLRDSSSSEQPSNDDAIMHYYDSKIDHHLSDLFGIGQYITLTPSSSSCTIPMPLEEYLTRLVKVKQQQWKTNDDDTTTHPKTVVVLTTWLQTAMNIAASHSECQFPVFGFWTQTYAPHRQQQQQPYRFMMNYNNNNHHSSLLPIVPLWAASIIETINPKDHDSTDAIQNRRHQTDHSLSPYNLLSGTLLSNEGMSGSFSCSVYPIAIANQQQHPPPWRWTTWGDVLLRHCSSNHHHHQHSDSWNSKNDSITSATATAAVVHLWYAQHTYVWYKQRPQRSFLWEAIGGSYNTHEWRAPTVQTISSWNKKQPPPPPYAPNYYLQSTTTNNNNNNKKKRNHPTVIDSTNDTEDDDDDDDAQIQEYRKQCQRYALRLLEHAAGATSTDPLWGPSEDPVESIHVMLTWMGGEGGPNNPDSPLFTLPLRARPTMSREEYDEMEEATESAILDPHRPNASCLRVLYDRGVAMAAQAATQRCALAALIRTATLPKETLLSHLVDETMLDRWDGSAGNKIADVLCKKANVDAATRALVAAMDWTHAAEDTIERWQAEEIVRKVFDGTPAHGFPSPPDSIMNTIMEKKSIDNHGISSRKPNDKNDEEDDNQQKTGIGFRPFAKAAPPGRLVSLLFTHMARVRSPSSIALVWLVFVQELRRRFHARESLPNMNFVPGLDPPPNTCSNHMNSHFANVGAKANLSGQINSSEPDPDSCHCLIGQKLQVFNIGIECLVNAEIRGVEELEKQARTEVGSKLEISQRSPSLPKTLLNGSVIDGIPKVDQAQTNHDESTQSQSQISQEFFDAEEAGSVTSNPWRGDQPLVSYQQRRRGARCPVLGTSLLANGDQLYAPYLMRPPPLTDDIIAEQRLVLARQSTGKASTTIRRRLEIIHRFQQPKLQSDMKSFKAANPGATFHDFISWYGNPDPMLDLGTSESHEILKVNPSDKVMVKKIDRGAEAIRALELTREFWESTWEQVPAMPAEEQELLFDAESTLEMVMDYLENIHPASLLCQVVAVNLAMSFFTLTISAGEAAKIRSVQGTLIAFRETIDSALTLLARDVTYIDHSTDNNGMELISSVESIAACTKACEALTEAEVVIARASSLLHKLPKQYKLVESILKAKDFELVKIRQESERETILSTIHDQQKRLPTAGAIPKLSPAIREYLLRNVDESRPCQLLVRYGDAGLNACGVEKSGIFLALRKVSSN